MPIFEIQSPDGKTYEVDAPDEHTAAASFSPPSDNGMLRTAKEFGKGALAGVASANPVDIAMNLQGFLADKISQGTGLPRGKDIRDVMHGGAKGIVDRALPVTPGYEGTRKVGEFVGSSVAPTAAGGIANIARAGAAAPAIVNAVRAAPGFIARDVLANAGASAASTVAAPVLGSVGEAVGGKAGRAIGETVGEVGGGFAGGMAVPATRVGRQRALTSLLTNENSLERLQAADRLGVTPSMGLVGNSMASSIEDSTAGIPFAGGPAMDARRTQYGQMDTVARDIAANVRGGAASGPISQGSVGNDVSALGETVVKNVDNRIDTLQGDLMDRIGADTVADVGPIRTHARRVTRNATIGADLKPALRDRMSVLESDRRYAIDPILESQLQGLEKSIHEAMANAPPPTELSVDGQRLYPNNTDRYQALLDQIAAARDANRGVTYGALKDWRSVNGRNIDNGPSLDSKIKDPLYGATTDVMRETAANAGVNRGEFDRIQQETTDLYNGPRDTAQRMADAREGQAYNLLFSPTNRQSYSLAESMRPHAANMLDIATANELELKTRGGGAGTADASPETFQPRAVSRYWEGLPEPQRNTMVSNDPTQRARMDDLALLAQADAVRKGTRTLPGQGGTTLGMPDRLFSIPTSLGVGVAGAAGVAAGIPAAALAATAGPAAAYAMGRYFTNPENVRHLIEPQRRLTLENTGAYERGAAGLAGVFSRDTVEYTPDGRRIINVSR